MPTISVLLRQYFAESCSMWLQRLDLDTNILPNPACAAFDQLVAEGYVRADRSERFYDV